MVAGDDRYSGPLDHRRQLLAFLRNGPKSFWSHGRALDLAVVDASIFQTTLQSDSPWPFPQRQPQQQQFARHSRTERDRPFPLTRLSGLPLCAISTKAAFSTAPQFHFGNVSRLSPCRAPHREHAALSLSLSPPLRNLKPQFVGRYSLLPTPTVYGPDEYQLIDVRQITQQANFSAPFQWECESSFSFRSRCGCAVL